MDGEAEAELCPDTDRREGDPRQGWWWVWPEGRGKADAEGATDGMQMIAKKLQKQYIFGKNGLVIFIWAMLPSSTLTST